MKFQRHFVLSCSFGILCLLAGGCAIGPNFSFDPLSGVEHHEAVEYHENRGVSHQEAERAAFEDNFFDNMNQ